MGYDLGVARYNRQEVEEILRRALQAQPVEELSHDELIDVAVEAGIDPSLVEDAARELSEQRVVDETKDKMVARRKNQFLANLWTFAAVNGPLLLVDLMSGPGWWVQWVMGGWAIALALMARRAYFPNKTELDRQASRIVHRKQRRRAKHSRKRGPSDLERAVDAGVRALVDAAAKKMSESRHDYGQRGVRVGGPDVVDAEVVEEASHRRRRRVD